MSDIVDANTASPSHVSATHFALLFSAQKHISQRFQILCGPIDSSGHRGEFESIAVLRLFGDDANWCHLRWPQVSYSFSPLDPAMH